MENLKRVDIHPDTDFFEVFSKAIKHEKAQYPQTEMTITVVNKKKSKVSKTVVKESFKFFFDWQDENTCGIEVYEVLQ